MLKSYLATRYNEGSDLPEVLEAPTAVSAAHRGMKALIQFVKDGTDDERFKNNVTLLFFFPSLSLTYLILCFSGYFSFRNEI